MPTVTTREAARRDLVEYFVYLAENADLDTADRFLINAEVSVNDLARHSKMGAPLTLKNPGLADNPHVADLGFRQSPGFI